jgi:hypothetical protein
MIKPPTRQEVRFAAYVLALCAVLIVGSLSFGIVYKANASARTAAAEADQIGRLNAQLDAQSKTANAERAALKAQNTILQLEVRAGALTQRATLRYLRNHGIKVPVNVVMPQGTGTGLSNRPKVRRPSRPHQHPQVPVSPGPHPGTTSVLTELCALVPMLCP